MRKIKVLIASMFGAIALVFACVFGTRINAASGSYVDQGTNTGWTTNGLTTNKSTFSTSESWDGVEHKVQKLSTDGTITSPSFTAASSVVIDIYIGSRDGSKIGFTLTPYDGDTALSSGVVNGYTGASKYLGQAYTANDQTTHGTFTLSVSGKSITKFELKNVTSSKNLCVYSISYTTVDAGEKTNAEKIADAIDAIQDIGTVSYSTNSKNLIAAATTKVNACDNGIDDISAYDTGNSTSYATTYNTAVSTYNGLVDTAVNNFTSSVTAIGTVNSESKFLIDAAYTAYAALLSSEQESTAVSNAKTILDSKHKEFVTTFGEVKRDLLTSDVVDILKTNVPFTEETKLYTQTMSSIFSATKGVQMDKGNSKTYNSVTYSDRFKTGGVMTATDGVVSCALKVKAPCAGKVSLVGVCGTSDTTRNIKVCKLVNGELEEVHDYGNIVAPSTAKLYEVEIPEAGTYYIGSDTVKETSKSAGTINFFKMTFTAKASVFAEMNDTTGTLRFVGTLTGITDLDDISSIELVLKKDGVATNSKIYLTTCYTSVTGTTQTCAAANGTYYVIFRLNNANSLATGTKISKQLIITLKDNSTVTSEVTEITM